MKIYFAVTGSLKVKYTALSRSRSLKYVTKDNRSIFYKFKCCFRLLLSFIKNLLPSFYQEWLAKPNISPQGLGKSSLDRCSKYVSVLLEHSHQWLGCVLHISVLILSEDRSNVSSTNVEQIKVSVGRCILKFQWKLCFRAIDFRFVLSIINYYIMYTQHTHISPPPSDKVGPRTHLVFRFTHARIFLTSIALSYSGHDHRNVQLNFKPRCLHRISWQENSSACIYIIH